MGEEQKGGRIVRSGLALTLAGTLMVPSTAAFAADGDDQAQQPSAASAVEQAMQQAQANGTDAQGNVTIIVQLEDGGSQGVSLFSRIMGTVKQSRHSYFKDQIRSMVNEEQAQGIALLSAEDADDTSGDATQEQQPEFQELQDYYHAIDGFAVKAPANLLETIRSLDGVKNAFIERGYEVPADQGIQDAPMNKNALNMTEADQVDQRGEGQLVAIIDSGLDVNHSAFKGDLNDATVAETESGVSAKMTQMGEGKNGRYVSEKIPFVYDYADHDADVDPGSLSGMDHGTHVAGIVGANAGEVRGTAEDAQIAMLKVSCNSDGTIYDSALLAAFDDAVVLKPDSVNVSLGSDAGFSDAAASTYGDAIESLTATGASVNMAAGNSYTSGYKNKSGKNKPFASDPDSSVLSYPSALPETVAVASVNSAEDSPAFQAADGSTIPYIEANNLNYWGSAKFSALEAGTYEYVDGGVGSKADADALWEKYPDGMGHNTIVLVKRGADADGNDLTFVDKVNNLSGLSPYAVVIYDDRDELLTSFAIDSDDTTAIMITKAAGEKLLAATDKRITKVDGLTTAPATAYQMSDFSSWGPTTDLSIKPEVTAPGGNIYSTVTNNDYGYKSGTSMATPQVAGISAQVRQYIASDKKFASFDASTYSALVSQLLMSTASPVVDPMVDDGPATYYSPRFQGAGLVNAKAAINTPAYLTNEEAAQQRPKGEMGESADGTWSFTLKLMNVGSTAQTYALDATAMSEQIAEGLFAGSDYNWTGRGIDVTFDGDAKDGKITVQPYNGNDNDGSATLVVNVRATDAFKQFVAENAANGAYVEGFVKLSAESEGGVDLSAPFLGFYGDWDAQSAIDPVAGSGNEHIVGSAIMNQNTSKTLGKNPLDSYGDADPAKAVVSSSAATDAPTRLVPFTIMQRNARSLGYDYLNADGKAVRSYSYDWISKTTYNDSVGTYLYVEDYYIDTANKPIFDGLDENGNQLPDGQYTLRRTATLATDGAAQQTLDQTFYYDTEKPQVSNVNLEGEGDERTVTFDVTDGSWFAGVNFVGPDDDPKKADGKYYQVKVPTSRWDDATVSDPVENADGTRTWHVSIPVSKLDSAWNGWSGPGHNGLAFPNVVHMRAWDYGSNISDDIAVVVNPVPATGVTLSADTLTLAPGQVGSLSATVSPADSTQTDLTWESSNPDVVKVDADGKLEGVSEGTAEVTVAVADNPAITAKAQVKVEQVSNATGVVLSQDTAKLTLDGSVQVSALVADGFAAGGVTWESSDESVVKVQQADGKLRQVSNAVTLAAQGQTGDADVTATVTNAAGEKKSATIHVRAEQADYADFVIEDGVLTGYRGESTNLSIPNDVTSIADGVFSGSDIQSVVIPASVTAIGNEAFRSTHNLAKVTFAKGSKLTSIGDSAFYGTQGLAAIDVPEGVTSMGKQAFAVSAVQRVSLPNSLTYLPESAFEDSMSLSNLTVSDGLTSIGASAFDACSALNKIKVRSADGTTREGLPASLATIGDKAFNGARLQSVQLPASVRIIGANAFASNASLKTLGLNDGLESIGAGAFDGTNAAAVTIPDTVTRVGAGAFANMKQLNEVTVGKQVPDGALVSAFVGDAALLEFKVADGAANYTAVDGVLLNKDATQLVAFPAAKKLPGGTYTAPESVRQVADNAFNGAQVTKVNVPDGLTSVGASAFAGAALTSMVLPDGFATMGEGAFAGCAALTYINIGGATEIPAKAFSKCVSLETVNLRSDLSKLTKIGALAFSDEETAGSDDDSSTDGKDTASYNGAIKAIILPDSVTEVGSNAFKNLTGMTAAHIGARITSGGAELFAGASSLETLTVSGENPVYSALDNVLYAQMDDGLHLVKSAAASKTENVAVQSGTVSIDREAFRSNRVIKSVVIPEGVRSIEWGAFNTCDNLASVTFPDSLQYVADTAFNWDLNLNFVEFGTNIKQMGNPNNYIGASAFSGHLPTHLIVRGGDGGQYVSSSKQDDSIMQSAYFGPGMTKISFSASETCPKILVVPADLESLEFGWNIGGYASDVRIYAPAGSQGYDVAKTAMQGTYGSLDPEHQLLAYTPLSVSLAATGAVEPGQVTPVTATAQGGVNGAKEFRFVEVSPSGQENVLADWSTADTLNWTVPTDGSTIRADVRDATWLTESSTLLGVQPKVTLDKSGVVVVGEGQNAPVLNATVSAPDGAAVTYQWFCDGAAIEGATGASYAPGAGDHAYHVVARVTVDGVSVNVASAAVTVKTVAGLASVDTQALSDAVAAAEKLNRGDYTAETWAPFAKALAAARAQLVNPESQAAVNGALEALVAAQSALAEANVDTAALQDAIVAADKLVESDYTADSWKAFSAALATAKNVLANPTTQQAADDALHALTDAQAALVKVAPAPDPNPDPEPTPKPDPAPDPEPTPKPDPDPNPQPGDIDVAGLQQAVEQAKQLNEADYTADSWKLFSEALAAAEQQLANPTSSADVSAALDALTKAQAGLVKVAAGTPGDKTPTGETPANGTSGANNGAGGNAGGSASATSSPAGGTLSQTGDAAPVAPLAATGVFGAVAAAIAAFFARRKNRE